MTELNDLERSFRGSVEDMLVIMERLVPQCDSLEDLTAMLELATQNNSQLRLLMRQVSPKGWGSDRKPAQNA